MSVRSRRRPQRRRRAVTVRLRCGARAGGNLGTPLSLAALELRRSPGCYGAAAVEVSSYQLELAGSFAPHSAVILNLTPDHLERHGSMDAYGAAKCAVFARMRPGSLAVIPAGTMSAAERETFHIRW